MSKALSTINEDIEFYSIVRDLINNKTVKEMKKYRQHYNTSTYEHCFYVAYISYKICKKLKLDYISTARAALLHDLFLYDWRNSRKNLNLNGYHAFIHPKIALENASKLFDLNDKEKDIIINHMWPVTITLPKYKESFIVTFVDKYSALLECFNYYYKYLAKLRICIYKMCQWGRRFLTNFCQWGRRFLTNFCQWGRRFLTIKVCQKSPSPLTHKLNF